MKKIELTNGFKASINEEKLHDMEFLEVLVEVDAGNVMSYPKLVAKLLTDKQKQQLYDKIRNKKGIVPVEDVGKAIVEIIKQLGQEEDEGKNS